MMLLWRYKIAVRNFNRIWKREVNDREYLETESLSNIRGVWMYEIMSLYIKISKNL